MLLMEQIRPGISCLPKHHNPLNQVLATGLRAPHLRTQLVSRPHLIERLQQEVIEHPLTLVSAPAGFGKTTLLAQWLADGSIPVAWISLEPEDNALSRFLLYMITALQTIDSRLGATILVLLRMPQPPSPETVFAMLANELTERKGRDFALVLDDYHIITAEPIHCGITFLLGHLPPQMHLILATRADPPLPLARLRAQGQLCEIRTADLRFGPLEVRTFLQAVMGLDLSPEAIATLGSRTEGWITGLQLAALSLHNRTDIPAFLAAFAGTHRFVLDYLSEEVLSRQPAPVRRFLLHTCILERLSEPLCNMVTEQQGSQTMLEMLDKANLFVVSLDDERRWYRYHHLFAEVLRSHLQQTEPALVPELHRRASVWCEQHDLPIEAVRHALSIPDMELAARLIERLAPAVGISGQISVVLGWLNALPEAIICKYPFLSVYYAALLAFTNQLEAAEARLQEAERGVQKEVSVELTKNLMGYILTIRGDIALFSGDIPQAISLSHQAMKLLPEAAAIPRAGALATISRTYLVNGDVTSTSEQAVAAADTLIRTSNNLLAAMSSMTLLAWLHVLQGRLRQAVGVYTQVVQVVPQPEVLQSI